MKVYGALEVAQLEWFTDAGKPAASNYAYRVIWVTDLKEIQVSDGSNWISFNSDQDARFDNTVDSSSTGANAAVPATTNLITLTNASLTSVGALSSPVEGRLAVVVNKTGAAITIVNEDSGNTAANRILTGNGADISIANNGSFLALYNSNDSRWHNISAVPLLDASVTNAKLANVATQTFKGRTTAGTGVPEDLTATQATAILNTFTGDSGSGGVKGLVPAPSSGDAAANKFLKASGSFTTVSGSDLTNATVTNAKLSDVATQTFKGRTTAGTGSPEDLTATQATAMLNAFVGDSGSGGTKGLVPAPAAGDAAAGKFLKADGTFSVPPGLGQTNFITNSQANVDTTGWATYADAAGTSPVDGTGGSPNVTWTRTTSSPLVGDASFLFTKDAANRQGQGVSYAFTIDSAYQAKVLQIEMDYIVASGTFVAGTTSTDSDMTVWIYDVTNAVLIQPTTYKFYSNNSTTSFKFVSNFQTASNSTSYRLILHVGSTSASAYTVKFDEVKVTPSGYTYGTPITDWSSYTPTWTGSVSNPSIGNGTIIAYWRRVGDSIQIRSRVVMGSSTTYGSGTFRLSIPSGLSFDSTKLITINDDIQIGYAYILDSGTTRYQAICKLYSGTTSSYELTHSVTLSGSNPVNISTNSAVTGTSPITFATGDTLNTFIEAPIAGWSSSVQTSDQADSRIVAASYTGTGDTSIAASSTEVIPYLTKVIDTHAAYNTSTGEYTVPVSGVYLINAKVKGTISTTSQDQVLILRRNGSSIALTSAAAQTAISGFSFQPHISHTISLNSGDIITVVFQNAWSGGATTIANDTYTAFNIQRLSQASLISATETVAASYTGTNDTSIAATTTEVIPYKTKVLDTHGAYNTTSGEYTVPVAGTYTVYAKVRASIASTGQTQNLHIYLNGSIVNTGYFAGSTAFSGVGFSASIIHTARFNAGDIITARYDNGWSGGVASLSDSVSTSLSITRIGL